MVRTVLRSCALIVAMAAAPALAERVEDNYWLNGQAFFSYSKTKVRVDNTTNIQPGTLIDLESDLAYSPKDTGPTAIAGARLSNAWRLEGEYLSLSRNGGATLARSITVNDTVYNVGAHVDSSFKTNLYRIAVGWSPVRTDTAEFGVLLGAHLTDFSVEFSGVGSVNGATSAVVTKQAAQLAPLPTLGLYGNYSLNQTFSLYGRSDFFAIKIGDYGGHLIDAQAGVQARVFKNFGVGAGFRYTDYMVRVTKPKWDGRIEYKYHGPFVFAELAF